MRSIVITGMGLVTAIGQSRQAFWNNLIQGQSGFSRVESFDASAHRSQAGAEIKDFRFNGDAKAYGRATQFALTAMREAVADAGYATRNLNPARTGVVMATTSGEPGYVEAFNNAARAGDGKTAGSAFIRNYPCNNIAGYLASELGVYGGGGPVMLPVACAAGNCAIGHAFDLLQAGEADVMLAGGTDAFSRITYSGFCGLFAVAPERCQPFDKNRKGMIPGEGAAILVLESKDAALARGARIYAEISGYGISCDAFHMTGSSKDGHGAARAMEKACQSAGIRPSEIDYISAHGTGTKSNDFHETLAVKKVFGEEAARTPMSSIKSMLGHTMGAASAIEACACSLAIANGIIPPTMNFEEQDPDCDLDYVPNQAREKTVHYAMNNAYAFGGTNASLILRKVED